MLPKFKLEAWSNHDRLAFVVPSQAADSKVIKAKAILIVVELPIKGLTSAISVWEENGLNIHNLFYRSWLLYSCYNWLWLRIRNEEFRVRHLILKLSQILAHKGSIFICLTKELFFDTTLRSMLPKVELVAWRHHNWLTYVVPSIATDSRVVNAKARFSFKEIPFEGLTSAVSVLEEDSLL